MLKNSCRLLLGAALLCGLGSAAFADASVNPTGGTVLANSGSGFHPVSSLQSYPRGTRVMANQDGTGEIVYSDGCRVQVKYGQLYTIAAVSPCKAAAAGSGGQLGAASSGLGLSTTAIGVVGLGGVAGLGIAINASSGKANTFASP